MKELKGAQNSFAVLALSSAVSVGLYVVGVAYYHASILWFLNWNLFLAWLPLIFAFWLRQFLKTNPWVSWQGALLTVLWLGFLPNSFYIISDLMHLNNIITDSPLFFAVLIFSFSFNGLVLGFMSLYLVHKELVKRVSTNAAYAWVGLVLLMCSFAVYLGRYLRWSTWDVILNPAGVLFDVSDRVINPVSYGLTFQVTALFFVLLGSMYFVLWNLVQTLQQGKFD